MLSFSLIASAIFLVVVNGAALARKGTGAGLASLCSLAGVVGFSCLGMLVLALNALLVAVVGAVCWWIRARPRWFLASSIAATSIAYIVIALPDLYAWNCLKKDYPLESLARRLAYEGRRRTPLTSPSAELVPDSPAAHHLASLEAGVAKEEESTPFYLRTQSLERLHAGVVQQFIDSPGFGVGRMMIHWPSPYRLEREQQAGPLPPIPQPTPPYSPADLAPAPSQVASELGFLTAHDNNMIDFLNPIDFGYIRDRDHIAGFRPHQFHDNPKAPERWRVNRLELVGILKHDEPVVYLSANFPRMDELSEASARPLDAFEREALAKLRGGEDLIVQQASQQMRMLGSIRAVRQCLDCHSVQRGELLGAFSYRLASDESPAK